MAREPGTRPLSFQKAFDLYAQHTIPKIGFPSLYVSRAGTSTSLRQTASGLRSAGTSLAALKVIPETRGRNLYQMAERAALEVTLLGSADAGRQAALNIFVEQTQKMMAAGPDKLVGVFNRRIEKLLLNTREMTPGEPLVLMGRRVPEATQIPGADPQPHLLSFQGSKNLIMLREMDVNADKKELWILAGGVFVGHVLNPQARPVPVIERGFMVGVPSPTQLRR